MGRPFQQEQDYWPEQAQEQMIQELEEGGADLYVEQPQEYGPPPEAGWGPWVITGVCVPIVVALIGGYFAYRSSKVQASIMAQFERVAHRKKK